MNARAHRRAFPCQLLLVSLNARAASWSHILIPVVSLSGQELITFLHFGDGGQEFRK